MAKPKKGQLAQFMVPMVDATDFVSIESAITASDFNSGATVKYYGLNQGGSAATTSGTVSKTASLVRSGVFRITLKGSENNYDAMQLRINKTGCAEQIIPWENVDNDDSDIMSALTVIQSMASDAASAAQQGNSRVLLNQSRISDVYSMLSDMQSDFQSRVPKAVATNSQLSDLASDLRSYLVGISSIASDAHSAATAGASRALVNQSRISDVQSFLSDFQSDLLSHLDTTGVGLNASTMSDVRSAINALTVSLDASNISDIASAVVAALPISSQVSDIYSLLSDLNSQFLSRIPKEPAARSQLSDMDSNLLSYLAGLSATISDAHSAAILGASNASDAYSAALLNQSRISDVYSLLSDLDSNFQSRVPKETAARSQLSDLASDVASLVGIGNSRVLINQSRISDVYSLLSDFQSDLVSHIDTTGVGLNASALSDIRSAITANGVLRAGADPTAVIGVTDTLAAKVDWLAAMSRNKLTQTATVQTLYEDDGTTVAASAAVSDDGTTYSRGEFA